MSTPPAPPGRVVGLSLHRLMALLLVAAAVLSALLLPGLPALPAAPAAPRGAAAHPSRRLDLLGFAALVAAVGGGVAPTQAVGKPLAVAALTPLLDGSSLSPALRERRDDLAALLVGIAVTLPLVIWSARRALLLFGVLQAVGDLGFWGLAGGGQGAFGGLLLPAFDGGFVVVTAPPTPVDGARLTAVAWENLTRSMGTAAHVAFQMSLCQQRFSATQYALLSACGAVGRVRVGPLAGVMAESIGWPGFFVLSTWLAAPAPLILVWLRRAMEALNSSPPGVVAD